MKRAHYLTGGALAPLVMLLTAAGSNGQPPVPPRPAADAPAFMKVWVPAADARLEVDGTPTRQTGNLRQFVSPPLPAGKRYYYELRVTYRDNGKELSKNKTVTVEPGKETEVDLRDEPKKDVRKADTDVEPKPLTEPKKIEITEPKKVDEPKKIEIKQPKKVEDPKPVGKKEETIEVPFVPTPQEVVDEMLKLAGVKEGEVVYDLGCGDGRIVVTAVKKFKAKRGWGVDLNPERVKDSEKTAKDAGVQDKVSFKQGDVLKLTEKDLADADVVTLYLLPEVNKRLRPVLEKGLKPGARIVSHDFDMGDWKPEKEVDIKDTEGITHTVYLWTIPGKDGAPKKEGKKVEPPKDGVLNVADPALFLTAAEGEKTIVVPYVPTPQNVVNEMLKLAGVKEGEIVHDLGCGDGRIVVTAVKQFKAKKGFGVDLNPERVKDSQKNAKEAGVADKVEFKQGDVLKLTERDLAGANVVTLYLLPEVNLKLRPVLQKALKPGSRVVSHDFDMGDWKADKEVTVIDETGSKHRLFLWTIGEAK